MFVYVPAPARVIIIGGYIMYEARRRGTLRNIKYLIFDESKNPVIFLMMYVTIIYKR